MNRRRAIRAIALRTYAKLILICVLTAAAAEADVLQVGTRKHRGTFEGFKNGKFSVKGADGKLVEASRISVRSLTLDMPRRGTILRTTARKAEEVVIRGYKGGKFAIKQSGKPTTVTGTHVKEITVKPVEITESRGGASGSGEGIIEPIDISGLERRRDMTQQQSAVLENYKSAREKYDSFLARSSAMVAEAKSADGGRRNDMLLQLRHRKSEEQPIKRELEASQASLLSTFPELTGGAPVSANTGPARKNESPAVAEEELTLYVPRVPEGQVLLIDTGFFEQLGKLSEDQTAAISGYNKAKNKYSRFVDDPSSVQEESDRNALRAELTEAQSGLLKAFPRLKLVTQD